MSKIKVFLRHWNGAINRKQNVRPEWHSYEKCYRSVKNADVDLTILLDGNKENHHFQFDTEDKVIEFIEENYDTIEKDMNNRNSTSKRKETITDNAKTRKKREELSISATKSIKKEDVEIVVQFN